MRRQRGFTLIELMVGSAVTFLTVLAVSAAFIGYTQSFYTQAGIRGGQASLRQTHLMVVRNLRMAGYGMEPPLAFGFPDDWSRESLKAVNRSDRLVFRMRNPAFNAFASGVSSTSITLSNPLPELLRKGQIIQVMCPGALAWTYAQLSMDAPKGDTSLNLEAADGKFPRLNAFTPSCFGSGAGGLGVYVFKIDVYDYSIRLIDEDGNPGTPDRPYLFRRHGLNEGDPVDSFGEPVAEDIEAMRVSFLRGDGSMFVPTKYDDLAHPAPDYSTPLDDALRGNNNPANIRAVVVGLVARSTTRDTGAGPELMNQIPAFGRKLSGTNVVLEGPLTKDGSGKPLPHGFRRVVSEMSVQLRNMRSSEMPVPVYTLDSTTPGACKGVLPKDDFNCAGG
ncbi:prepilin-type N-terminal cleavage/methylation domain-containing protein [Archangium sp.]|uniref:prepilin-type N-terminal cleavage/methylation domain-containing protein n=1 Tax=Archangium sp. TaxID=1872627 RepID=UPI002D6F65D8|nr:prepilin-type N-terminal cleavage/methylation domain-containing protein [Archangium sp.]HYO58332.1 prepilin-type N-terminal cleavage/methylation domain-containing protein [Archangium sp.]